MARSSVHTSGVACNSGDHSNGTAAAAAAAAAAEPVDVDVDPLSFYADNDTVPAQPYVPWVPQLMPDVAVTESVVWPVRHPEQSAVTMQLGGMAPRALASARVSQEGTSVLATVSTAWDPRRTWGGKGVSILVLENMEAAGVIPPSITRRSAFATEARTRMAAAIEAAVTPFFATGYNQWTEITITLLETDQSRHIGVLAMNAVSLVLQAAGLPWNASLAAVELLLSPAGVTHLNPTDTLRAASCADVFYIGNAHGAVSVQAHANKGMPISDLKQLLRKANDHSHVMLQAQARLLSKWREAKAARVGADGMRARDAAAVRHLYELNSLVTDAVQRLGPPLIRNAFKYVPHQGVTGYFGAVQDVMSQLITGLKVPTDKDMLPFIVRALTKQELCRFWMGKEREPVAKGLQQHMSTTDGDNDDGVVHVDDPADVGVPSGARVDGRSSGFELQPVMTQQGPFGRGTALVRVGLEDESISRVAQGTARDALVLSGATATERRSLWVDVEDLPFAQGLRRFNEKAEVTDLAWCTGASVCPSMTDDRWILKVLTEVSSRSHVWCDALALASSLALLSHRVPITAITSTMHVAVMQAPERSKDGTHAVVDPMLLVDPSGLEMHSSDSHVVLGGMLADSEATAAAPNAPAAAEATGTPVAAAVSAESTPASTEDAGAASVGDASTVYTPPPPITFQPGPVPAHPDNARMPSEAEAPVVWTSFRLKPMIGLSPVPPSSVPPEWDSSRTSDTDRQAHVALDVLEAAIQAAAHGLHQRLEPVWASHRHLMISSAHPDTQTVQWKDGGEYVVKVTNVVPYGVFVEYKPPGHRALSGLVHRSKLSMWEEQQPENMYKVQQELRIRVIRVAKGDGPRCWQLEQI